MEPMSLTIGKSVKEMIESDLQLEHDAVASYNESIRVCVVNGDNGSRDLFMRLLKDEEGHVDWLEAQVAPSDRGDRLRALYDYPDRRRLKSTVARVLTAPSHARVAVGLGCDGCSCASNCSNALVGIEACVGVPCIGDDDDLIGAGGCGEPIKPSAPTVDSEPTMAARNLFSTSGSLPSRSKCLSWNRRAARARRAGCE